MGGRPGFDSWVGKIPWRRERLPTPVFWPGEFHRLYSQSMGSKRVRHNWGTFTLSLSLSLVVQWLRLCTLNAGVLGSIPGQGTRSYILQLRVYICQLKILHTMTKTRLSQINKQVNKWMKELPQGHTVRTRGLTARPQVSLSSVKWSGTQWGRGSMKTTIVNETSCEVQSWRDHWECQED